MVIAIIRHPHAQRSIQQDLILASFIGKNAGQTALHKLLLPHMQPAQDTCHCIEVKNLMVQFGDTPVLENISFRIEEGDYVGIIGANGSGKTTLLRAILGLQEPTSGEVLIMGKSPHQSGELKQIGYVPQKASRAGWDFPATVAEVVLSGRTPRAGFFHRLTKQDREAAESAMQQAEIFELRNHLVGELSGGQRQRVFIARALAAGPCTLILDEPTANVDEASEHAFYDFLRKLNADGITIILVTHDIDVATQEASTIICINRELVCHLPASEFIAKHHLEAIYGKQAKHIMHRHQHND